MEESAIEALTVTTFSMFTFSFLSYFFPPFFLLIEIESWGLFCGT